MGSSEKWKKRKKRAFVAATWLTLLKVYVPSRIGSATTTDNPLLLYIHRKINTRYYGIINYNSDLLVYSNHN